jgi:uncharacterized protein YecT (DUF1311 family)
MRTCLPFLLLGALVLPLPQPASAAPPVCTSALSTAAETRCLQDALKEMDRRLDQALAAVAAEARGVPGETFQTLWRENLSGFYGTSVDPQQQAESFRTERRRVCAYAKSVAFQGTGYGVMTTSCELALTQTLLEQMRP